MRLCLLWIRSISSRTHTDNSWFFWVATVYNTHSARSVYTCQHGGVNIIKSWRENPCMQLSRTGQLKHTGLHRSWSTDLTLDPNELLGVASRPRRKLHISQISPILHTACRGINTWRANTAVNNKRCEDEGSWNGRCHQCCYISVMMLFMSDPAGCCWSWGGSQAGRRTLGSALWHPPCCPWRLTPTPSSRYKTSALGCRSLPEQRWDATLSHLQCTDVWNFATGLLIINILCLIYCSHLNIILFPDVCRKLICCHLKGAFHLLIKFHNLQWKSLERQCNLN